MSEKVAEMATERDNLIRQLLPDIRVHSFVDGKPLILGEDVEKFGRELAERLLANLTKIRQESPNKNIWDKGYITGLYDAAKILEASCGIGDSATMSSRCGLAGKGASR